MLTDPWIYASAQEPVAPGWYPILRFWSAEEGAYPASEEWKNGVWAGPAVLAWINQPHQDPADATDIAYEKDPGP